MNAITAKEVSAITAAPHFPSLAECIHADALDDNAIIDDAVRTAHDAALAFDAQRNEEVRLRAEFEAIGFEVISVETRTEMHAADLARHTANAAALLADASSPISESVSAYCDAGLSSADLTDDGIIEFGVEWEMDLPALVARLEEFCVRARDVMGVAA